MRSAQVKPGFVDVKGQGEEVTRKPRRVEVDVSKQRPDPPLGLPASGSGVVGRRLMTFPRQPYR
jgi:hypothetical protein